MDPEPGFRKRGARRCFRVHCFGFLLPPLSGFWTQQVATTSTMPARVHQTSTVDGETTGLCFGTHPKQKLSQATMIVNSPARWARHVLNNSGKKLSILLIRALAMAPAGRKISRASPGRVPAKWAGHGCRTLGGGLQDPQERFRSAPNGPQGSSERART